METLTDRQLALYNALPNQFYFTECRRIIGRLSRKYDNEPNKHINPPADSLVFINALLKKNILIRVSKGLYTKTKHSLTIEEKLVITNKIKALKQLLKN